MADFNRNCIKVILKLNFRFQLFDIDEIERIMDDTKEAAEYQEVCFVFFSIFCLCKCVVFSNLALGFPDFYIETEF